MLPTTVTKFFVKRKLHLPVASPSFTCKPVSYHTSRFVKQAPGRPKSLAPDVEERVLELVDVNPGISTRIVAMQEGISANSI